jgi:hypothetical protein
VPDVNLTPVPTDSTKVLSLTPERPPKWLYIAVFCGAVLVYWLPRLARGFWVDEAGAYWIAHGGWTHVWDQLQIYPGQSVIYAYVSSLFVTDGPRMEVLFRLPSVAGMLLVAWLLYDLTERIAGNGTGWLAIVPLACTGTIIETATNARPYALGVAVVLLSFRSLRKWVHEGTRKQLILYCASSVLVVYFHYLFALIFVVQAVYLIAAHWIGRSLSGVRILGATCFVGFGALPLVWQFLTIVHQSSTWKTTALPTAVTAVSFFPIQVLMTAGMGLILFFLLHREWFRSIQPIASDDLVLLITWVLLGPAVLFVGARITSYALFATRYLIYALPPCFILLAWGIVQIVNLRARFALTLAIALNAALYVGSVGSTNEWRTPLAIAQTIGGANTPILLRSGFVESGKLDWKSEPQPGSYLFAPLLAYPVPNEIIPMPFYVDRDAEGYLEHEIQRRASVHRRFCLVAEKGSDVLQSLPPWFRGQGYRESAREVGGFSVILFTDPNAI